jgi:hypothetical protein
MFEEAFEKLVHTQRLSAKGVRLELLNRNLVAEKKLLKEVVWPVFRSLDGIILEYELVSITGVRIYIDVFYERLGLAIESEGFVVHAENITRDRFSFERMRIRTILMYGYRYIPFTWDELDKRSEACRRYMYELLGRFSSHTGLTIEELSVPEREVLRYARTLNRPIKLKDACYCLQLGPKASRRVLLCLVKKQIIIPIHLDKQRVHAYVLEDHVNSHLI